MSKVNTKDRIMQAALELFVEQGYQKTSIGSIEKGAGLVPRAGAFYRHFDSKEALVTELARTFVSETPEDFGLDKLADFGDTRAELIAIALKYEEAMVRQQPYARLIEELRLLDFGAELQSELDADMTSGLVSWISHKPAASDMSRTQRVALIMSVIGGWLFYLSMVKRGDEVAQLRDTLLEEWASRWAGILDTSP